MPPTLAEVKLKDSQLTPEERTVLERLIRDRPYVMRLTVITSKKRIHKSAVIRGQFRKRFRAIVRRCVQRGGAVQPDAERESPKHWLLPGHYYVVHPLKTMLLADEAELSKQVEEALVESKVCSAWAASFP